MLLTAHHWHLQMGGTNDFIMRSTISKNIGSWQKQLAKTLDYVKHYWKKH